LHRIGQGHGRTHRPDQGCVRRPSFDQIFAINVNLFWVQPDGPHLPIIANLLRPGGRLSLFHEAPTVAKTDQIVQIVQHAVRQHGFATSTRAAADQALKCVESWLEVSPPPAATR
jgi:hypothetical protein